MRENRVVIPSEIEKFFISKDSLKSILGKSFGAEVESFEVSDGEVSISFSNSILNEVLGNVYRREIDAVDLEEDEAKITLGEQMKQIEEEVKEEDDGEGVAEEINNEDNGEKDRLDREEVEESEVVKKENDELNARLEQLRNAMK